MRINLFVLIAFFIFGVAMHDIRAEYSVDDHASAAVAAAGAPDPIEEAKTTPSAVPSAAAPAQPAGGAVTAPPAFQQTKPAPITSSNSGDASGDDKCSYYMNVQYAYAACQDRLEKIEKIKESASKRSASSKKSSKKSGGESAGAAAETPASSSATPSLAQSNAALMQQAGVTVPQTSTTTPPATQ